MPESTATENAITRALREICPRCADGFDSGWQQTVMTFVHKSDRAWLETIERVAGRMVRAEHDRRPRSNHTEYAVSALFAIGVVDDTGSATTELVIACENAGIPFNDAVEIYKLTRGLAMRTPSTDAYQRQEFVRGLIGHLTFHASHVPPEIRRALNRGDVLLLGIDLWADSRGEVPLCKCLRVACATTRRNITRDEAFWMARAFTPARVDDLIALLENELMRTNSVKFLLYRPGTVERNDLASLMAARSA